MWQRLYHALNIVEQCRFYRVPLRRCPQFLFLLMGIFVISAIVATNLFARRYAGPEATALIVLGVSALLFIVGHIVIASFQRTAEAVRAKSEFISIMSHQLRGPLAAMRWQLNVLLGESGERAGRYSNGKNNEEAEELEHALFAIEDENQRMIRLVSALVEVNRIDDRDLFLRRERVLLSQLTQRLVNHYRRIAAASNVSIKTAFPDGGALVWADEAHVKTAMAHLLDNAVRYSAGRGTVIVAVERLPGAVRWSVTDEGIGITNVDKPHIFEKFFRGHHALRYQTGGLGVGLYIVRAVIEGLGGTVGFRSQYGQGSSFWFTLPVADSPERPPEEASARAY